MKKRLVFLTVGTILVLGISGACGPGDNRRDLKGVKSQDPDLVENYNNMDGHPNIGKVCIDGVAFLSTTRDYDAVTRVPELDRTCPGYSGK